MHLNNNLYVPGVTAFEIMTVSESNALGAVEQSS